MDTKFKIIVSDIGSSFDERPPISYKVRDYFEDYIRENLLTSKKIIINSKWEIHYLLCFIPETERYKSDYLFFAKAPKTVVTELVKIYECLIPTKLIKSSDTPYLKTLELMWEAISMFFTTVYKKVKKEDMDLLWKNIDITYMLSLPYPAPLIEQKYLTDIVTESGEIKNAIGWFREG